ncbi:MAG: tetratricopeptide repeat protein [Bacteroidia bacterium]|nr:tetratricopeptide repeat protein [Bacteroidia bacterium]
MPYPIINNRYSHYCVYAFLFWQFLVCPTAYSQTEAAENNRAADPLKITVLPFCEELSSQDTGTDLNSFEMYDAIMASIKVFYDCADPLEWVSKNGMGNSVSTSLLKSRDNERGNTSCEQDASINICESVNTDLMVRGEYLISDDKSVEVYYSYENCKGIYSSQIEYLSSQPIVGSLDDLPSLYNTVGQAIQKDLQKFLDCKSGMTTIELSNNMREAKEFFHQGDESVLNYLKSIELFEKVEASQHDLPDAKYHLGLAYFSLGEYEKAKNYFVQLEAYKDAEEYTLYCDLEAKPAIWYNNPQRRRMWWDNINSDWKKAICSQVFHLPVTEVPPDQKLDSLFNISSLQLERVPLADIKGIQALTKLTQLSFFKTELRTLDGIESLVNLGQISLNNNKIESLKELKELPLLTRIYCRNNPLESLEGVENMAPNRSVIFCGGSVSNKEMKRIRSLGIKVQP